jgi:Methyltransferase domain
MGMEQTRLEQTQAIERLATAEPIPEAFYAPSISDEFLRYLQGIEGGNYPRWLAAAVRVLSPKTIVELGSREGLSTASILSGLSSEEQVFYSVDVVEDLRYVSESAKMDPRFRPVVCDCRDIEALGTQYPVPETVGLLFLDTIHTYAQVSSEFHVWEPLLANGCLVAIDDIRLNDKGRFFDELTSEKYDMTDYCHVSGFGVFFYERRSAVSAEEALRRSRRVMEEVRGAAALEDAPHGDGRVSPKWPRLLHPRAAKTWFGSGRSNHPEE